MRKQNLIFSRILMSISLSFLISSYFSVQGQTIMFDDFTYSGVGDPQFAAFNKWNVVTGTSGPPEGAQYRKENINFVADPANSANKFITLSTTVNGQTKATTHSRIETGGFEYFEGTYAARVYLSDEAFQSKDGNIQTFFTIVSSSLAQDGSKYSELDIVEYMAADKWGISPDNQVLYTTSYHKYIADPWKPWKTYFSSKKSWAGWHTFIATCTDKVNVKYYIDDVYVGAQSVTDNETQAGLPVYPRSNMQIAFANWIWNNALGSGTNNRTNTMQADWVLHYKNQSLSLADINTLVSSYRSQGIQRRNLAGQTFVSGTSNQLPSVSITSPVNNATYTAPASITINSNASDADGSIAKVEFYNGSTLLGSDNTSPYSYTWTGVTVGTYSITAKATDNLGAATSSIAVNVIVSVPSNQLPTVSITSPSNNATYTTPASIAINANASDTDGSIAKVDFYNGSTLLGSDNASPYSYTWTGVTGGTYSITAKATDNLGATATSTAVSVIVSVPQSPYGGTVWGIPGTIEVENYDLGGQGVAYNELSATNEGGAYRTSEPVDIEATTGGGFNVGYILSGEWLEYTVNVTSAGTYTIDARVAATAAGKTFRLELDGTSIGSFTVPNTTAWQTWQTVTVSNVSLTAGQKVLRMVATSADFNLDKLVFTKVVVSNQAPTVSITSPSNNASFTAPASITINANASDADGSVSKVEFFNGATLLSSDVSSPYSFVWNGVGAGSYTITVKATDNNGAVTTSTAVVVTVTNSTPAQSPYGGTAGVIPGIIEVENYDLGGQGIAFNELSTTNEGGAYRTSEPVDIEPTTGGGYNVGYVLTDEWLEYSVNVAAGTYKIEARVAATAAGKTFRLELDGVTIANFTVPNTGAWQTWQLVSVNNVTLTSGSKVLRMYATSTDFNLDRLVFTNTTTTVNQLPSVAITSPTNNSSYNVPTSIILTANASDSDGSISKVEFYNGSSLIGSSTTPPYTITWINVTAGTYTLRAKATDNIGDISSSNSISVKVNAVTSNLCTGVPQYTPLTGGYVAGSRVQSNGSQYECKPYPYSGWCNAGAWAYEPGTGYYWADAWTLIGPCAPSAPSAMKSAIANEELINSMPNPFMASTNIEVVVKEEGEVSIKVYDKTGVLVGVIAEGYQYPGIYNYSFDASKLRSDVYFIKYTTNGSVATKKIVKAE